jgi:phage shock protein C
MTENATISDYQPQTSPRLFRRSRTDRMLGGVCGGLAEVLGVDAALLRIALVAATLLGFGAGAVIYLVCWLVVPETS